ncbi:MAG: outer membrane lipoprotein chaperone LolA [Gammaproteobacteria bacterium]
MKISLVSAVVALTYCLSLTATHAQVTAPGHATLQTFLNEVNRYTARFEQRLFDEYGELIEQSSGTVALAKPGKFRWEYREPYSQQIISNGQIIWVYDEDLAQVSISQVAQGDDQSPLALLVNGANIEQSYKVEALSPRDDLSWVGLTPKLADSEFQRVEIGVSETDVVRMRLHDNLNQLTELTFLDANKRAEISDNMFEFTIPAGIDVVNGIAD